MCLFNLHATAVAVPCDATTGRASSTGGAKDKWYYSPHQSEARVLDLYMYFNVNFLQESGVDSSVQSERSKAHVLRNMRLQSCSIFFALVAFLAVGTRADHPVPVFLTVPKWQNGDSPSVILPSAPRNQGSITTSIQGGVGQSNTQQSSLTILPSQNTVLSVPEYGIYFNGLVRYQVYTHLLPPPPQRPSFA